MSMDLIPQGKPELNSSKWNDALLLEVQLTREERTILDSARAYA